MNVLSESWEKNKFRYKEIEMWEKLYRRFNVHCCPPVLAKQYMLPQCRQLGLKYVACFEYNKRHMCAVVPIIIGSYVDREIQKQMCTTTADWHQYLDLQKNFNGTLLNYGFFSYFPKYILNNNKQLHTYKSYNQVPIERFYLYNKQHYGHMLYMRDINGEPRLVLRFPSHEEYYVDDDMLTNVNGTHQQPISYLHNLFSYRVGTRCEPIRVRQLIEWFSTYSIQMDIDDIINKSVYSAPLLLEALLESLAYSTDAYRAKSIKQAITAGNLFVLLCKKESNNNTNKLRKTITRSIAKFGSVNIYQEKIMYCTVDEGSIDTSLNQIKRTNSQHSKYIKYQVPSNSEGIISPYYCANMEHANKTLLLTYHCRITFVDPHVRHRVYLLCRHFACRCPAASTTYTIVFNSLPTSATVCDKHILEYFLILKLAVPEIQLVIFNKFLHVCYQSGSLQYPIQTRRFTQPCSICRCKNAIITDTVLFNKKLQPSSVDVCILTALEPLFVWAQRVVERTLPRPLSETSETFCGHHIFINNYELKFLQTESRQVYTYRFHQLMCHDSLRIGRYINLTPQSKTITAVKNIRTSYLENNSLETNKELTKGYCRLKFIPLFTVFYDFEGRNVEDGYILNERVKIPTSLHIKNSIIFSYTRRDLFYWQSVLRVVGHEIVVGKLFSATALVFKKKRMIVRECAGVSSHKFVYELVMPIYSRILNYIDKSSLRVQINSSMKKAITISLMYQTVENIGCNIKLSNSYGQKGMVVTRNLDSLTTTSGQRVDLTANPYAIVKRSAYGQIKDMKHVENVYHNGKFVGLGGFCNYIIVNTFPHENIHGGAVGSPMKLDKQTFNAAVANEVPLISQMDQQQYSVYANPRLASLYQLTKLYGKELKCTSEYDWVF